MPVQFEETTAGLQMVVSTADGLVINLRSKLGDVLMDSRNNQDLADRMGYLLEEAIAEMERIREDLKDPAIVLDTYEAHVCDFCENGVTQGLADAADHCPHCSLEAMQFSWIPIEYRVPDNRIRLEDPAYDIY